MIVCPGCSQHVKGDATVCPFCQASLTGAASPPAEDEGGRSGTVYGLPPLPPEETPGDAELNERARAAETLDALTEGPPGFAETADGLEPLPPGALADTADELEPFDPEPSPQPASLGLLVLVVALALIVLGGIAGILVLLRD